MRQWVVLTMSLLVMALPGFRAEAAAPTTGETDPDRVVARVNQTEITYGAFEARLEDLQRERGPIPPDKQGELLRALVREEVLAQEAVAEHLEQDAAVKVRMEAAKRQVLVQELLRRQIAKLTKVTDEDVRKMYEENKPLFTAESVGASHIMVKSEAEAEAIRQELVAGKDFAELAKAKSQDTGSAEKGGDLGMLSHGQTVPEFETAAFALKEGELSPVVKTQYGYHIIKGGPHKDVIQPFDEVKDRLRENIQQQRQREAVLAYIGGLEHNAKIELFEDKLR
ncbi:MAG TPA: peptidylprolyl isomerase [Candidatus Methylomirabilis sp.]|nr:peptidylprolyl isomerase [Candidatus Methylomirabilis sp.]